MDPISQKIRENIDSMVGDDPYPMQKKLQRRLRTIKKTLAKSKTGAALLKWGEDNNICIAFDTQLQPEINGIYFQDTIVLSPQISNDSAISILAHELRHAWQDKQGLLPNHCLIDIDDYRASVFMTEGDAFAHQMQVCQELDHMGIHAPLTFMQNDPETMSLYGQAVKSYNDSLCANIKHVQSGHAMLACFWGWMQSHARDEYDDTTLGYIAETIDFIEDKKGKAPVTFAELPSDAVGLSRYFTEEIFNHPTTALSGLGQGKAPLKAIFEGITGTSYPKEIDLNHAVQNVNLVVRDIHAELKPQYDGLIRAQQKHQNSFQSILKTAAKPKM